MKRTKFTKKQAFGIASLAIMYLDYTYYASDYSLPSINNALVLRGYAALIFITIVNISLIFLIVMELYKKSKK